MAKKTERLHRTKSADKKVPITILDVYNLQGTMIEDLKEAFDKIIKRLDAILTNQSEPRETDEDEEDVEEDEGKWIIVFYPVDDEEDSLYFRGQLDTEDPEENGEVWDKDIRKAVVYDSHQYALSVCQSLQGPLGDDGDINVNVLLSKHRKKASKVKVKKEEDYDEDEYDEEFTYYISTIPKNGRINKKFPRLFYQEGDDPDGNWVRDWRYATHYPNKHTAQIELDADTDEDPIPEDYKPATIVKMDKKGNITQT